MIREEIITVKLLTTSLQDSIQTVRAYRCMKIRVKVVQDQLCVEKPKLVPCTVKDSSPDRDINVMKINFRQNQKCGL